MNQRSVPEYASVTIRWATPKGGRLKTYPSEDTRAAFVSLERGEDLLEGLNRAVAAMGIEAATLQVIGGLEEATVGYFDPATKRYLPTSTGHVEICAGMGNVSIRDGKPFIHLHLVLSGPDGTAMGGHAMEGCARSWSRPTSGCWMGRHPFARRGPTWASRSGRAADRD
jgi:uncharacterized protein